MKKPDLDLYTDYLLSTFGAATATGLSAMVDGDVSHDQITRFLSAQEYTSKDLWQQVKSTVRSIEHDDTVLIFDDTIQEKAWTDESELMCWHFDHCSGRTIRGINLLNALYYCTGTSIPVAFELVKKPIQYSDIATKKLKRKSDKTKNEMMREMNQNPRPKGRGISLTTSRTLCGSTSFVQCPSDTVQVNRPKGRGIHPPRFNVASSAYMTSARVQKYLKKPKTTASAPCTRWFCGLRGAGGLVAHLPA